MSQWWRDLTDAALGINRSTGSPLVFLAQDGSFSAGVTRRVFTITSGEILNIIAAPPVIVPAPPSGFMVQILTIASSLRFNTTAYADAGGSAGADFRYAGPGANFGVDVAQLGDTKALILSLADAVAIAKGSPQAPLPLAALNGLAIEMQNVNGGANDFTLGDSDLVIDVAYLTLALT